jgi:lipoate-protein ligase A
MASSRPTLHVLRLAAGALPLLDRLCLEEALLRADARNWLVTAHGAPAAPAAPATPTATAQRVAPVTPPPLPPAPLPPPPPPTIVLGVAGKLERLVHVEAAAARGATVLRRFSGGGTVVVDAGTLFAAFVLNQRDVAPAGPPLFPRDIMRWSEGVYAPVFARAFGSGGGGGGGGRGVGIGSAIGSAGVVSAAASFSLREHDYCWGDRKVGGNAQSVSRDRWVHHTSFLWDFDERNMQLLQLPERRPEYRRNRAHGDFVAALSQLGGDGGQGGGGGGPSREQFLDALEDRLRKEWDVREATLEEALEVVERPAAQARRSNEVVPLPPAAAATVAVAAA